MPSNEFKRAVRDYMAEHGVNYTTALRAVTDEQLQSAAAQPAEDSVRAEVAVTELTGNGDPSRYHWKITVFDPRADRPMETTFFNHEKLQERLDELADTHGWRRLPGQAWPVEPTPKPVDVRVERSDLGRRNDEADAILKAAGLTFHEAHEPYLAAVAHELERAGVEVQDWFANPDDPRNGAIELADPIPGYEQTHVAWREDMGWYYMPSSDRQSAHADRTVDLEVGFLDEPYDVAAAACKALDRPFTTDRPEWSPPADYNPDAAAPEDWDASPDFERALTCYTTYPGWDEYKNPTPRTPADNAPDVFVEDPFTGCWRSWSRAKFLTMAPEMADDGWWLHFDITIAGEQFDNHDGMLQFRRGHDTVAYWLKDRGAPVGAKHREDQRCRVCHDDHDFDKPTDLAMLEHRGHQIRAAYERLNGFEPGQGALVLAERDGDVLVLTLRLINNPVATPHTRLRAFQYRSDSLDGWVALVESAEHPGREIRGTALLNAGSWMPREIGRSFESMGRYYLDAGPSEEPATLEQLRQRAHQVRAAAEELLGLEPHTGITVEVDREGDELVANLNLTEAAPRTRLMGYEWRSEVGWLAVVERNRWPVVTAAGVSQVWDPSEVAAALVASIDEHAGDGQTRSAPQCPRVESIVVLQDTRTGCWRAWTSVSVDDGTVNPVIDGEAFDGLHNESRLVLTVGDPARTLLRELEVPVGSQHGSDPCLVCHDDDQHRRPTTIAQLRHRAHQVRAATERLLGLEMGAGITVDCRHQADELVATLTLTDAAPRTRLIGYEWDSGTGWWALTDTETRRVDSTPIASHTEWKPSVIARSFENSIRDNS